MLSSRGGNFSLNIVSKFRNSIKQTKTMSSTGQSSDSQITQILLVLDSGYNKYRHLLRHAPTYKLLSWLSVEFLKDFDNFDNWKWLVPERHRSINPIMYRTKSYVGNSFLSHIWTEETYFLIYYPPLNSPLSFVSHLWYFEWSFFTLTILCQYQSPDRVW